ncbi:hypothetical protein TRL7639_04173 [Falsiruegeria litorea R37]|uniref:Tyrosine specific protein phosphatases domain-containing protein n=1 Tax=Falsiruegeria litorea R37 TaxID=1200284 RepID=A0A1Y5TSR6_9RHOB|nr:dual specificity protein phosphatase family protein [Falsiruegeria litorea]SLN70563.1 hypothetical protein TRL7639_04173 [Falsiruegeria litorea R37]
MSARFHFARRCLSLLATFVVATVTAFAADASDYTARDGGPSSKQMIARSSGPTDGLAFFRPVMSGVLYRSGFHGGDKGRTGLSSAQREALCEAGFSGARYIDFGKHTKYGTTQCGARSLDYQGGRSTSTADIMRQIHASIKNLGAGPVLVHCMWGVHSSGAVSAMALVQFCGWSEERAKKYWDDTRNGADCSGGCANWIDKHFAKFKLDPSLQITSAEQAAICPQ